MSNGQIPLQQVANLAETLAGLSGGGDTGGSDRLGADLTKCGLVITKGGSGDPDEALAESPTILRDPKSGRYVMAYVGYDAGTTHARACYATSNDLATWTKRGVLLAYSGTSGAPDQNGVSGPLLLWDDDGEQYVLYYIGLTSTGYESGTKTICMATATSLAGPWTRHGAAVTTGSGWRASAVWHANVVHRDGLFYMFFNATGSDSKERIGYATAPAITGPWTVDDTHSPVLDVAATAWDSNFVGDPSVRRVGDLWVMDYYGYNGTAASDGIAVTPDADFPLGWIRHPNNPILTAGATYDAKYAHKPFVFVDGGRVFHFYTAVAADDTRQIALAVSRDPFTVAAPTLTVQDENSNVATGVTQIDFQGAGVTATAGTGEVIVTIPGGSSSGAGELLMQDGVTGPPVPIENEARSDWLYQG